MSLVQELDAKGWPLIIPALALTAASLDTRNDLTFINLVRTSRST